MSNLEAVVLGVMVGAFVSMTLIHLFITLAQAL
jgi:hypothetical protein